MSPLVRALLLSVTVLLLIAAAAVTMQVWLQRQAVVIRQENTRALSELVSHTMAITHRSPETWDASYLEQLGRVIGGTVALERVDTAHDIPFIETGEISFVQELDGHPGWVVRATAPSPTLSRLRLVHQRALAGIILFGLFIGAVPFLFLISDTRRSLVSGDPDPWIAARAEATGLAQFARLTVERGAALKQEQGARVRAEEDLQVSRSLLDQSLEERIRLGRELHDNVSQSLYAVTLTLESVRKKMSAPPAIEQRLDQCMAELRRLNREVRNYLRDLEPDSVHREPLETALATMLASVTATGAVAVEQRLDDDAVRLISPRHTMEIVNIVRAAATNSVRHGRANRITVRAARGEDVIAIAVSDDGVGFDADSPSRVGHGLQNMHARAAAIGGALQVDAHPGKGTRVLLTLPIITTA